MKKVKTLAHNGGAVEKEEEKKYTIDLSSYRKKRLCVISKKRTNHYL